MSAKDYGAEYDQAVLRFERSSQIFNIIKSATYWLGHESVETTQIYLHADMEIKKQAMDQTRPTEVPEGTYQPDDALLAYLNGL